MQNPFKTLGDINQLRKQAMQMQQALAGQQIVIEEGEVRVVISGDQRILEFSVQGVTSDVAVTALNKAIKKSQEMAAAKLQEITGDISGLMGGGR
jgi:nucleoid-associated protein EbfC